jgi:hypothetical protein
MGVRMRRRGRRASRRRISLPALRFLLVAFRIGDPGPVGVGQHVELEERAGRVVSDCLHGASERFDLRRGARIPTGDSVGWVFGYSDENATRRTPIRGSTSQSGDPHVMLTAFVVLRLATPYSETAAFHRMQGDHRRHEQSLLGASALAVFVLGATPPVGLADGYVTADYSVRGTKRSSSSQVTRAISRSRCSSSGTSGRLRTSRRLE